jgi:hypothetical protein
VLAGAAKGENGSKGRGDPSEVIRYRETVGIEVQIDMPFQIGVCE